MPDLFEHAAQKAEAKAAKAAGMEQAAGGALPEWSILMLELVRLTCLEQPRLTSDDVFDRYDAYPGAPTTHDARAFGPVMVTAAKLGMCRKTDRVVPSRRKSLHASPRAIWESLIYVR